MKRNTFGLRHFNQENKSILNIKFKLTGNHLR